MGGGAARPTSRYPAERHHDGRGRAKAASHLPLRRHKVKDTLRQNRDRGIPHHPRADRPARSRGIDQGNRSLNSPDAAGSGGIGASGSRTVLRVRSFGRHRVPATRKMCAVLQHASWQGDLPRPRCIPHGAALTAPAMENMAGSAKGCMVALTRHRAGIAPLNRIVGSPLAPPARCISDQGSPRAPPTPPWRGGMS